MKTYLFDFDGTLVDSMPSFISAVLKELDRHNCKYSSDIISIITPLGFNGTADYFIKTFNLKLTTEELVENFKNNMASDYFYHIPAKNTITDNTSLKAMSIHTLTTLVKISFQSINILLKT